METPLEIMDKLNGYIFHDMPVESITFSTESGIQFILNLLQFDEATEDSYKLKLTFNNVQKLESQALSFTGTSDMEIYDFDYAFEGVYKCKIQLLTGFGEPGILIELSCESIQIS
jgi:hypothetical protein